MRGKIEMRSDYGLYSVAIICFIISAVFAASLVPGYELNNPSNWASGVSVTVIFLVIGIISAAVGYSARPKAMMPATQPIQRPTAMEPTSPASQPEPEAIAPAPLPSPVPSTPMPEPSIPEPTTPEPEPTTTDITAVATSAEAEQPVKVEEPEKPKPTRRRRKKTE